MRPTTATLLAAAAALTLGCSVDVDNPFADGGNPRVLREMSTPDATDFDRGAVELRPETHVAAGRFAEQTGRFAEARQQYRRALDLDPRHAPALRRLGVLQTEAGDHAAARQTLNAHVAATGGSAEAYALLGRALAEAGDPLGAESAYLKGLEADADHDGCRVGYGLLLARQGRVEAGTEQLARALPMPAVLYHLGAMHEAAGRPGEAEAAYREALALDPALRPAAERLHRLAGAAPAGPGLADLR